MDIKRIAMPKFKIGRNVLNLAELWQYRFEIAQGLRPEAYVKDIQANKTVKMLANGGLSQNIPNMSVINDIHMDLLKYNQKMMKREEELKDFNPFREL